MAWCALIEQHRPPVLPGTTVMPSATASGTLAAKTSALTEFSGATTTITTAPTNATTSTTTTGATAATPEITTPSAATTPIPEGTSPLPLHRRPPTQAVLR